MDIEITFINQSDDSSNSSVVVFQKNVADKFNLSAVAWTVIQNCGRGWKHRFSFPMNLYVGARDSWGNVTDLQLAENGQKWNVVRSASGDILTLDSNPASSFDEIEIKNYLPSGSVDAEIYRHGKLLATRTGVSPQQKGVFKFKPTIWVGVVSEVEEGDIMSSTIISEINTEISLSGIVKADLIMTGGSQSPFKFILVPTATVDNL